MNAIQHQKQNPRVVIFPRPHLPVICPSCSNSLGIIDETEIENRYAWADVITQIHELSADDPHAEVNAIHGDCPHCRAALVALSVTYRAGAAGEPQPPRPPRLSIVLHHGASSGWAMIESIAGDTKVIEHLFEPRPARRLAGGIEYLREFLLSDLPRPQAAENEIEATD